MRWARTENGIVREIIDLEPQGRYTEDIVAQFVVCEEDTEQGDIHNNGIFSKFTKSQTEIKNEQKQQILQQLEDIDKKSVRDAEDLIELLINKNIIKDNELPGLTVNRIAQKKALRQQLKDLE